MRSLPVWSYFMPCIRPRAISLIVLALVLVVAGCAATSGATTPTTSPQTASACANAPGFFGAKPPTAGARFPDLGFPAGAVGYSSSDPEANWLPVPDRSRLCSGRRARRREEFPRLRSARPWLGQPGYRASERRPEHAMRRQAALLRQERRRAPLCRRRGDRPRRWADDLRIAPHHPATGQRLGDAFAWRKARPRSGRTHRPYPADGDSHARVRAQAQARVQIPAQAPSQVRVPPPALLEASRT